jgi:tRNA(Ile)-lysidine synthase
MARERTPPSVGRVQRAFDRACAGPAPLADGARLLLGCSAGGDSMALLDLAARRAAPRRWALAVVHLDHAQRAESAAEADFVRQQADRHGLTVFIDRLAPELLAPAPLSEEVMRQARHSTYRRYAAQWRADAVVLAHQADDRAETLLIRLLAGSGPTGLAAIRPVERIGPLTLVRPLLGLRRAALREYLSARGLQWRDDPTNARTDAKRGWVRHVLLPLLGERIGLDPTERLARAAELLGDEAAALGDAADLMLRQIASRGDAPLASRFDLAHPLWSDAGALLRRQLVRHWLWSLRSGAYPPGRAAVGEALAFIEQARPGAELRTIERIHVVHAESCLLAFAPQADAELRDRLARPYLPAPAPRKRKPTAASKA